MSASPNAQGGQKDFDAVRVSLASPSQMEHWSHGEVTKPETINYRTQKPEKDGLFDERIFGPTKDWECYCGKYKKIRYKGIVCDKCGVEVTRSAVRRERLGHIKLAAPVVHIWYLRGTFSRLGLLLGMSIKYLEKVVYFANFVIISVDEAKREEMKSQLKIDYDQEVAEAQAAHEAAVTEVTENRAAGIAAADAKEQPVLRDELTAETDRLGKEHKEQSEVLQSGYSLALDELATLEPLQIITEAKYRELTEKYRGVFQAGVGAEAILEIINDLDLNQLAIDLESEARETTGQRRRKALKRLNLVEGFRKVEIDPAWMILTNLPVIPPDLRPMVQLDGGRFAASDLNDLYRRVINRNNRLKKLMKLRAPEVIQRNEKRMLQEAVDALIDNSARRGRAVSSIGNKRRLKSLSDMLKGKQGRFRQNLLGKRVDYSGRSVIVGGANLKLDECGIPKRMALELFKPFVIGKLLAGGFSHNVKSASKMIDRAIQGTSEPAVWDMLEEVTRKHYVLLNRAPTLHRLGIQAFKPLLIEGKAIKIHPLVCSAFNADFDGDQMAVHVPLSIKAQEEARLLMSAKHNLLKPAAGEPVVAPTLEIVLGCFYLTSLKDGVNGEGSIYASSDDAILANQNGNVHYQAKVRVRLPQEGIIETSVGRILFNAVLPDEMPYLNQAMDKKALHKAVGDVYEECGSDITARVVDDLKALGFQYSTHSGITISADDLSIPEEKPAIIAAAQKEADAVETQYEQGLITDNERYMKVLEQWMAASKKIEKAMLKAQDTSNPVYQTVISGARGNTSQLNQMAGMKGLVANPSGKIIELPIISNYKEGFKALEYFISTHGTRKGLTDKGLRTPDAGYLTRRLVDVAQDTVVLKEDCGTTEGLTFTAADAVVRGDSLENHVFGRVVIKDVKGKDGKVVAKKDTLLDKSHIAAVMAAEPAELVVRSILTCNEKIGTCQRCYGLDLATGRSVRTGEAVGVIAAQSIGEPGTQLTMRTFHTGGVAAEDITQGLPRVEELFEARPPKGQAVLTELAGTVKVVEKDDKKILTVTGEKAKGEEEAPVQEFDVPTFTKLRVKDKEHVAVGTQLTEGTLNLHELMSLRGKEETWRYIIAEVQQIYAAQAQYISDKHIEIVVKEMLSKVRIADSGDTNLIPSEVMSEELVVQANHALASGKEKATYEPLVLGITKASLLTESFLSAASFQETTKILIDAALTGKTDHLRGLKENVIIGKLIPAGTGMDEDYLYSKVPKEVAVLDAPAPQTVVSIDERVQEGSSAVLS